MSEPARCGRDFETVAATENQAARRGVSGEPGHAGPGRRPQRAAQPCRRRLAGPAPQPDLLDLACVWSCWSPPMASCPALFTANDPRDCVLSRQHAGPSGGAIFGYDFQGCDTYSRAVYGARASLLVGALSALLTGVIALVVGMLAGYFGGWVDAVLSRVIDIVLGIPLLLAAIVLLKRVSSRQRQRPARSR